MKRKVRIICKTYPGTICPPIWRYPNLELGDIKVLNPSLKDHLDMIFITTTAIDYNEIINFTCSILETQTTYEDKGINDNAC